eukprot:GHVU01096476.1.p1 GENE.GHVU01096476.1~~GHVU01096476.1.p1  ORF type:complete len:126 (-),score=16.57 GHVU01096476.1:454-831(-)
MDRQDGPLITLEDAYNYLGIRVHNASQMANANQLKKLMEATTQDMRAIAASALELAQKIHAISRFITPQLFYVLVLRTMLSSTDSGRPRPPLVVKVYSTSRAANTVLASMAGGTTITHRSFTYFM